MTYGAECWVNEAFAINSDLRIALKVVVKFFARMPMPVKLAVRRYFNKIYKHLASRSERFTQSAVQQVCDLRVCLTGAVTGAGKKGNSDEKS